jgi:hypothetical protein
MSVASVRSRHATRMMGIVAGRRYSLDCLPSRLKKVSHAGHGVRAQQSKTQAEK